MFRSFRATSALSILAIAFGVSTPIAAADPEITLKGGTSFSKAFALPYMMTDVLKPKFEEYTKGRLSLESHVAGSLCNEKSCVEQVKLGQTDLASVSIANYGGFSKTFEILTLPYVFADTPSAKKVMTTFLAGELRRRAEKEDKIKMIAVVPMLGFRALQHNLDRTIKTPNDIRNVKIRVTKSPLDGGLLRSWGATAVPVDWSDTYDAVRQKVARGLYLPQGIYVLMKFNEVAPKVTMTSGAWTPMMFFMDINRYNKLPDWARAAVDKASDDLQTAAFDIDDKYQAKANETIDAAQKAGKIEVYKPTDAEMKQWRKTAAQSWLIGKKLNLYDPKLALRVLQAQDGQEEFIAELKKIGAL